MTDQPAPEEDEVEPRASTLVNHGKIEPTRLSPEARETILVLMNYLEAEPGLLKVQVTFDYEPDQPPTIHVITEPTQEAVDRWLS